MVTENFDSMLEECDAIYLLSHPSHHYEQIKTALSRRKSVLVEAPIVLSEDECKELQELADNNEVILMEALKTAYAPGFCKLVDLAQSGIIGEIVDVEACFTRLTPPGSRERDDALYGGSLLELGSYVLLPALRLLGTEPKRVSFDCLRDTNGLDLFTKVHLDYDGSFALGKVGLGVKSEGALIISGTCGNIVVSAPWWKTGHCEVHFEDYTRIETYDFQFEGDGLRYEISDFAHRIMGHAGRRDKLPAAESIAMAGIVEQFLQQENRR
jgi:predicted dehydrogenase